MGWQVTATTVRCQHVGDFATIMVQPDGTSKCSLRQQAQQGRDSKRRLRDCKWPDCPLVSDFQKQALAL